MELADAAVAAVAVANVLPAKTTAVATAIKDFFNIVSLSACGFSHPPSTSPSR